MNSISLGIIGGLSDKKFASKINPLIAINEVDRIYLLRRNGNPCKDEKGKVTTLGNVYTRKLPKRLFELINLFQLSKFCFRNQIDAIIGIYIFPHGFYSIILGSIFSKPTIIITTGTDLKKVYKNKFWLLILKKASLIGVRGNNSKADLNNLGIEYNKLFVLPNVFELPIQQNEIDLSVIKKYDLLFIGYLRKLKRVNLLIDIVFRLKKIFPDVSCAIVGDGSEKQKLIEYSKNLGLQHNIKFKPHSEDINNFYLQSKVFVMTSESEGLPMVLVEAMSFGLPVVAPGINDIPSIITHEKNGFLVNSSDINSYCELISSLLKDDNYRNKIGAEALDFIHNSYSKECSYENVYNIWLNTLKKIQ